MGSLDPHLVTKVRAILVVYLIPSDESAVLTVDEKSWNSALARTQSRLPFMNGQAGTMTHDHSLHGTATLVAALDAATGKVSGACLPRHRAKELLTSLNKIYGETPKHRALHFVLDNSGTHKAPEVEA